MSKYLDEPKYQKKVKDKIEGYGRVARFFAANDTDYEAWYISPPRQAKATEADSNHPVDSMICLVAALDIPFTPQRGLRMLDMKTSISYRIVEVDPIDSGDLTQAYRIWLGR